MKHLLAIAAALLLATTSAFAQVTGTTNYATGMKAFVETAPTIHGVPVDVAGTILWRVIPNCTDTGGNHLNFTQATDAFSCGTSGTGGGGLTIGTSAIASGTTNRLLFDNAGVLGEAIVGSGLTLSAGTLTASGGAVSVTAATPNIVVTPSPGTGTFTIGTTNTLNTQSGTGAYAIVGGDAGKTVLRTNASGGADTIGQSTASLGAGYSVTYATTGFAGNTITPTTSTINGLSILKLGANQYANIDGDGTNYHAALGLPQPATQTGTTYLADDMTWKTAPVAATTATAGLAKLHNVSQSVGWVAAVNPNKAVIAVVNQASTISAIIGRVADATGGVATVSVFKAPSGTACASGTVLHSGSFDANGTANTNQTLTVTTSAVSAGDVICITTTGTTTWTSGTGIGNITVFLAPS